MKRVRARHFILIGLVFSLAACSAARESRFNPFNWFGRSQEERSLIPEGREFEGPIDNRKLIDQITAMRVNRTPGGALVEAVGVPVTQGHWQAELVAQNDGIPVDGVLTYEFRIAEPFGFRPQGTPQSREITVATAISNVKLQRVTTIRVVGARNARTSRR